MTSTCFKAFGRVLDTPSRTLFSGGASSFQAKVREQSGIEPAVGQAQWADSVMRVGTMGWTYEPELQATLEVIEAASQ